MPKPDQVPLRAVGLRSATPPLPQQRSGVLFRCVPFVFVPSGQSSQHRVKVTPASSAVRRRHPEPAGRSM
jgi:hypothetical protein